MFASFLAFDFSTAAENNKRKDRKCLTKLIEFD